VRSRFLAALASAGVLAGLTGPAAVADAARRPACRPSTSTAAPSWERQRRMTVLVDSVLLGSMPGVRSALPCWRISQYGRPALMIRIVERELRRRGRRVDPLVVVGLGYNSLWERGRRRYGYWARRFDGEAVRLIRTLRRLGARQIVWVTLREPTARYLGSVGRGELGQYSWYFPWVNARLRRLAARRDDTVLANWTRAADRPGITYDSIHVTPVGARLMGRTIKKAVVREAARQELRGTRAAKMSA